MDWFQWNTYAVIEFIMAFLVLNISLYHLHPAVNRINFKINFLFSGTSVASFLYILVQGLVRANTDVTVGIYLSWIAVFLGNFVILGLCWFTFYYTNHNKKGIMRIISVLFAMVVILELVFINTPYTFYYPEDTYFKFFNVYSKVLHQGQSGIIVHFQYAMVMFAIGYCLCMIYKNNSSFKKFIKHPLFIGIIIFCITVINDVLVALQVYRFIFMSEISYFIIITMMTRDMVKQYINHNYRILDLNINLEKKVIERTKELEMKNKTLSEIGDKLLQAQEKVWSELDTARKIQNVLIPKDPQLEGFEIYGYLEPTDQIGGDYYDIFSTGKKDWIFIGDVSGHGIPATLVMGMVQTTIHTLLMENENLIVEDILVKLNTIISANIHKVQDKHMYMTMTALEHTGNGCFKYAGAHQEILVYRAKDMMIETYSPFGVWIGVFSEIKEYLTTYELKLYPDDVMLLYTDGITEAWEKGSVKNQRQSDKMFGLDRLKNIFYSACLERKNLHEIWETIIGLMDNYDINDDVTLVLVKKR